VLFQRAARCGARRGPACLCYGQTVSSRRGSDDVATRLNPRLPALASESTATYVLTVIDGPDRGSSVTVDGSRATRLLVGTSPACELRITDPLVSRRHIAAEATPRGLRVTDLGSTNGTFYQRVCVTDATLQGGETLVFGDTTLRVDVVSAAHHVALSSSTRFGRVFGASVEMRKIYPLCERLAVSNVPVIIEGETGTGKEFLAEALHEEGPRAQGPFVVFDCTAVPPNLVESTLFGHERGAFTSAVSQRKGVFEQAHGGTLLIDEIGDLEAALQPKLLRALERSEVQRVGSEKWIKVDVRVLAATRRDLDVEVHAGRFREDLFFRLAVARVELPPLRARHGDVGLLVRHFWRKLDTSGQPMPDDLVARFEAYAWPGNVRELRNAVARRLALGELEVPRHVPAPASVPPGPPSAPPPPPAVGADVIQRVLGLDLPLPRAREQVIEEFERLYIERVLARHDGNVTRAAHASGIARRYFHALKSRLGV